MNIKEYLHLYLGCEVKREFKRSILDADTLNYIDEHEIWEDVKLILRPLSNISDGELLEVYSILYPASSGVSYESSINSAERALYNYGGRMAPSVFVYLLYKHFDLFGLIEAGLAIAKTKEAVK